MGALPPMDKTKVICIFKDPKGSLIMDGFTIGKTYEIMFRQEKTPSWPKDGYDPEKASYVIVGDDGMPCMISEDNMWINFATIREDNLNKLGI